MKLQSGRISRSVRCRARLTTRWPIVRSLPDENQAEKRTLRVWQVGSSIATTPPGAQTEQEASRWVRAMFGQVARRYDLANHLLSANIDVSWRNRVVERVRDVLDRPGSRGCLTLPAAPEIC